MKTLYMYHIYILKVRNFLLKLFYIVKNNGFNFEEILRSHARITFTILLPRKHFLIKDSIILHLILPWRFISK